MAKAPCGCYIAGTQEDPYAALTVIHSCPEADHLALDIARARDKYNAHILAAKAAIRAQAEGKQS